MLGRRAWILTAAAAAAVLAVLLWREGSGKSGSAAPRASVGPAPAVGSEPPSPASAASKDPPSHLADGLNSPAGDIRADLRIVDEIFRQYRSTFHGGNPVGNTNARITSALTGRNRLHFAFIPAGHPALNAKGELCDRWGTPFFFHQLSGIQMEIRSAGPDQKLWTADDEVLTPGLRLPRL